LTNTKNYGLYAGSDMGLFVFYFKDVSRNVVINYYRLDYLPNSKNDHFKRLKFISKAPYTSSIAAHSLSFNQYIGENEFGQQQVYYFN